MRTHHSISALLVLAAGAATSFAQSTVPVKLVYKEGDAIAGSTISSLNSPFTDGNGRMASVVIMADARRLIIDETLAVLFDSGSVVSPALTGAEGTIGISNAGGYIYSPSIDGEDGVAHPFTPEETMESTKKRCSTTNSSTGGSTASVAPAITRPVFMAPRL